MRFKQVLCAAGVLVATVALGAAGAGAQTSNDPHPPAITDFANFPLGLGIIPATCTSEGADSVVGERFSVDGGPEVTDLRQLNLLPPAQALVMRWDSFAPGCEQIGVALSRKSSGSTVFDPTIDQFNDRTAYCGPEAGAIPCAAPYQLTLFLGPQAGETTYPCYQVDASLGPPLAIVGPSGAFYGFGQPFNMLISAWNGGIEPCGVPVPPTTVPPTTVPPTTVPPTTVPPTVAPSTTLAPSVTTTVPGVAPTSVTRPQQPCPPDMTVVDDDCVEVAGAQLTIPVTGAPSRTTGVTGSILVVLGVAAVAAAALADRWARPRAVRVDRDGARRRGPTDHAARRR